MKSKFSENLNKSNFNKFNFNFFEYITNKKKNIYKKIDSFKYLTERFMKKMDIINYFKIEKKCKIFQKIFLNENQSELFSLLSEKIYHIRKENIDIAFLKNQSNAERRDAKIVDYLFDCCSSDDISQIDQKLADIFYNKF